MLGESSTNQEYFQIEKYSKQCFLSPRANVKQVLCQGIEQENKKEYFLFVGLLDRTPFYSKTFDLLSFLLARVKTDSIFSGHPVLYDGQLLGRYIT